MLPATRWCLHHLSEPGRHAGMLDHISLFHMLPAPFCAAGHFFYTKQVTDLCAGVAGLKEMYVP